MRSVVFLLLLGVAALQRPATVHRTAAGYDAYLTGNAADVVRQTRGGLQLEGGGTDIPDAFRWLLDHAGGGDVVVLRASGADGYNDFLMDLGPADSVESIVFHGREAAFDDAVLRSIDRAEAVFLAGGDQANYLRFWKGTPVQAALDRLAARGVPIGGTSAGLAVLGEFSFAALNDTVTSAEALADPYDAKVTLERAFLQMPHLAGVITDSHFVPRDRLGRLLAFLGRIVQDGWRQTARAIAVDEEAALLVEADGSAHVVGKGPVYFLQTSAAPEACQPGKPLTLSNVSVVRVGPGSPFDLSAWKGTGTTYTVSAAAGTVRSSNGGVY